MLGIAANDWRSWPKSRGRAERSAIRVDILSRSQISFSASRKVSSAVLAKISAAVAALQDTAATLSELDVLASFAERADSLAMVAPVFTDAPRLEIRQGRHPIVEYMNPTPFVANDLDFTGERRMLIVTGPNMGGKSTYMRQTALIVIMAHIGSFVPAEAATIGPIDAIFTRIGAADNLSQGQSTFMVEMTETANILHNATPLSLVLIDEIGRGTSTFDGMALAWAAAEHLAKVNRSFTLFATHYFELTGLAESLSQVANVRLDAIENGDDIIFMHCVKHGPANRSYGLAVALLAGIPRSVIEQAKERLAVIEDRGLAPPIKSDNDQLRLFDDDLSRVQAVLKAVVPDELSPKEALDLIYHLRAMIGSVKSE